MRIRLTIRGDEPRLELRGYLDLPGDETSRLREFAAAMEPYGLVIASPEADNYDPFAGA